LLPNWAQGEENYTLKREEFIQFLFTKSETLDSCRFETKMRQHAPNPISIFIFPAPTPLGALPPYPGMQGGDAKEGRERERKEGKGTGREGDGGSLSHRRWCDRRPWREIE